MANQCHDRRRVLEILAKAAMAAQYPGFCRWAFAAEHHHDTAALVHPKPGKYVPQFFDAGEYRTIEVLTDLIIPADETPGAKEAGVSEFIDFMAAHGDDDFREPVRTGLAWLNGRALHVGGKMFSDLPTAQQGDLLKSLAYKSRSTSGDQPGRDFFQLIRKYTVMGYYTSRIGLQELDYPGLEFYTQSPECPHKDDPAHQHLPAPKG